MVCRSAENVDISSRMIGNIARWTACNAPQNTYSTNNQTDEIMKQNIVSDSVIMGGISTEVKYETTVNKTIINDNETTIISHMKSMIETMNSEGVLQSI